MPAELQSLINDTNTQLKAIGDIYFNAIEDYCYDLHDALTAEGCPNSGDVVLSMRYHFGQLRDKFATAPGTYRIRLINTLQWINDNWPEAVEYELTMSKIMDALWDAKPHQCLLFIPMIDAMRGAIMGKTVTLDYMGEALRRFL